MNSYSLTHLADQVLLRDLATIVARDRTNTAELLAHIAEVDARKLYVPAAHPSMRSYCIGVLRLSEEAASKRIHAARAARKFPAIFPAVAEGKLHLSAVVLLAPHLTTENADELLAAATHRSKAEIERLLADRFPRPDLPTRIEVISPPNTTPLLTGSLGAVDPPADVQHAPGRAESRAKVAPLAPERFGLQFTIGQTGYDDLRYAQALLSHQTPPPNVAEVIERALRVLVLSLEKGKFAATDRPRRGVPRSNTGGRYVPAHVKRAVWERDQGQCTFVSEAGQRCAARTRLEFDHIDEVARGGEASIGRMRLRCRAHNLYAAECTFGSEFMNDKRQEAQRVAKARAVAKAQAEALEAEAHSAAARKAAEQWAVAERQAAHERATAAALSEAEERVAAAAHEATERAAAAARANELDVVPCLRNLGFRADEARLAARHCDSIPDASIEQRVRAALKFLCASKGRTYDSRGDSKGTTQTRFAAP